jgi:cyclase
MSDGPEHAHEIVSPGRPRTIEVADGVYAYVQPDGTWWINNTGFIVGTPFLLMGSVAGCVEALETVVLALGARTVVPGHGPVFEGTGPIEATLDYLRFVIDVAARGRAAGLSPLEAARQTDLGRFAGWPDAERLVGNLHRAYAELAGAPRGAPVDVAGALADMVAYNGGRRLTCLALASTAMAGADPGRLSWWSR